MYIENTAKISSTPKWQEAISQSLFVTGEEGEDFGRDHKKCVYIENTARIRSTPKWQEAMDQSLFVTGGEGEDFGRDHMVFSGD